MYSIVLFIVETSLSGILRVGREAEIGGRQHVVHDVVGDASGELDVVAAGRARRAGRSSSSKQSPLPISVKEMSVRPSS